MPSFYVTGSNRGGLSLTSEIWTLNSAVVFFASGLPSARSEVTKKAIILKMNQ